MSHAARAPSLIATPFGDQLKVSTSSIVVDAPHLLAVLLDELLVEPAPDGTNPVLFQIPRALHGRRLRELVLNHVPIRHPLDIIPMDRKAVERVVGFDVGPEFVIEAAPQRTVRIEVLIDLLVLRQKVPRTERVGVPAVPGRPYARAEIRQRLDQRDVPITHHEQLVRRRAAGEASTDDQGRLHF